MRRKCWLALLAMVIADGALAADPPWKAQCRLGAHAFTLVVESVSGEKTEDDMVIDFARADSVPRRLPLSPGWFQSPGLVSNVSSLCDNAMVALPVGADMALLLLARSGRPQFDTLAVALVDLGNGTVLDSRDSVAPIKNTGEQNLTVRRREGGFDVRLQREWLRDTNTDSAENSIEDWMRIDVVGNHLDVRWAD